MNVLLFSTYELGHQPLSLAWPLAALEEAGVNASAYDLSIQDFPESDVRSARLVAFSVPMLTAMRLGVEVAKRVRELNPAAHICFYGHYALLNEKYLREEDLADSVLAGEIEPALVALTQSLGLQKTGVSAVRIQRMTYPIPQRNTLPSLDNYARLDLNGEQYLAGYTEATRGCLHTCTHCPIVPVYEGRFFAVPVDVVIEDVRRQVEAGAEHITFGDPDFLNGPTHAMRVARALNTAFPGVTFDFTAKVEHLLEHAALLPELVSLGALFVVSAFESTSDLVLQKLDKGHDAAQMDEAIAICRSAGLALQSTWVAFTPWTSLEDYLDMIRWVRARKMIAEVPAVQFAIRLLVPPTSVLLSTTSEDEFGSLDAANFTHTWDHPDFRMDELHRQVSEIVEKGSSCSPLSTFKQIELAAYTLAGLAVPEWELAAEEFVPTPRLTEDWFC